MSNYVNNLNELINTKKELKDIIIESTGENPSEVFSYYPSYIRSAIASGGSASEEAVNSYISAYLSAYNFIDQTKLSSNSYLTSHQDLSSYATKSYVVDYVATYAPTADLSSYVTKTELSSCGYITSIPSEYITQTELSACGYITSADVPGGGAVIDENIIPKESLTYTIGDASHLYDAAYTNNIKGNDSIKLSINNTDKYTFANGFFAPTSNSGQGLGHKDYYWRQSYITNLFGWTLFSSNNTNTRLSFTNNNTIQLYANNAIYTLGFDNFSPENDKSKNLGTSSKSWLSTYTKNLYLDGTNLEDRLSSYVSKSELSSCGYITMGDVSACGYITANDIDLSDYVTYSYAYNTFVSYSYLGDIEEITEYILGSGSSSAPENIYATKAELGAYVSKTSLESMSYITMDDIDACGYVTASDISIPVIDENLIPKETDTYTLGDSSNLYDTSYTNNIFVGTYHSLRKNSNQSFYVNINGNNRYVFSNTGFFPAATSRTLGQDTSTGKWQSTYTTNIYTENVSYTSGKSSIKMNDRNVDIWVNNKKMINLSDYNGFVPTQTNVNLGGSSNKWGSTYTSNLYADTIHNFIWTGTSAEYAALDNYTSYQIYLIKES